MKRCSKCGDEKPRSGFNQETHNKDGLGRWCRSCCSANNAARYARDPAATRERSAIWREANPERNLEMQSAWRNAHPGARRIWAAANRDKETARWHRREARKRNAFVEDVLLSVLLERDQDICGICASPFLVGERPSVDHIIPLSKGGQHSYTNTQAAHLLCNIRKGARVTDATLSQLQSAAERAILSSVRAEQQQREAVPSGVTQAA